MKIALGLFAMLIGGISVMAVTTSGPAHAVVYCEYVSYPAGCVVKPGVVLRPRPAGVVVAPGAELRPVDRPVEHPVDRPVDREIRR